MLTSVGRAKKSEIPPRNSFFTARNASSPRQPPSNHSARVEVVVDDEEGDDEARAESRSRVKLSSRALRRFAALSTPAKSCQMGKSIFSGTSACESCVGSSAREFKAAILFRTRNLHTSLREGRDILSSRKSSALVCFLEKRRNRKGKGNKLPRDKTKISSPVLWQSFIRQTLRNVTIRILVHL